MNAIDIISNAAQAFAPPPPLTGSEYADKYVYVPGGPVPGKWSTARTPDLKEPLDCITDPSVSEIVIVKPTRMGGTAVINIAHAYGAHYEPKKMLYAQSTLDQGTLYSDNIWKPIVYATPVLSELMLHEAGRKATQTKTKIDFSSGASLRIIGAKSPRGFQAIEADLATGDDLDEWEVNKYGDQVAKLRDRTKGIWNSLVLLVSFPTRIETSRIWEAYLKTDMRERWVPCPHCGNFQILKFGGVDCDFGLKWKTKTDNAEYLCEHCRKAIPEYYKDQMNNLGEYRAQADFHGRVGFQLNPLLRSWIGWNEIKAAFLDAGNDPYKCMVFNNQTLGQLHIDKEDLKLNEHVIYDRAQKESYKAEVKSFAKYLTLSVDTQDNFFSCEVYGWGPGEESCSVEVKIIPGSPADQDTQDRLEDYRLRTFKNENGEDMGISRTGVDLGGHYTDAVYAYVKGKEGQGVYAVQGSNNLKADVLDGSVKINKETGAKYQRVGVENCKDILRSRLNIDEPGPGYIHHPRSYDIEYYRELFGEKPIYTRTGRKWQPVIGRRNEAIDRYNYGLAMLRSMKIDWEAEKLAGHIDQGRLVYKNHAILKADGTPQNQDNTIILLPSSPIIICCDFKKNPLMWVLAQTDGRSVKAFDEISIQHGTTARLASEVQRRYGDHKGGFQIYGSAVGKVKAGGKSEYMIMRDYGFTRKNIRRINPPEHDVINAVNNMLENIAGLHRLTYHPRCINLKRDFEQAIWIEDMSGIERTDFGRGNATQALGYFIEYKFPMKGPAQTQTRTHWK